MKEIKVFVVMGEIQYEGECLIGVFSSEAKAQAIIDLDEASEDHYDNYRIVECGIDEDYEDL